ncbi:archaetidylserine decarboxylase [Salinisphaera sp. RV14]|uniref:archaetidylserine decarboxylase n=1 Tax=unclassified Salinisphaera TaxID=2649847 RepID=UPI003F8519C4
MLNVARARAALNFWITNRMIPRRLLSRAFGGFSRIEHPLVARLSIAAWRLFSRELDLSEARKTSFASLHDCFTRELRDGARPVDMRASVITSPCDGVVVACGPIRDNMLFQAKGIDYDLHELLDNESWGGLYRNGRYATLRLTAAMYHRFHAPYDCSIRQVRHIAGDLWNVNPPTFERVPLLYCRNERVVMPLQLESLNTTVTLVAVGAVLVGSIRLDFIDSGLNARDIGPATIACEASVAKGDQLGHFQHGSTIIVLAPEHCRLHETIRCGQVVRMGQPLMQAGTSA